MKKGFKKGYIALCTVVMLTSLCQPIFAQYNKEYFYWAGRKSLIAGDYLGAIRTLNTLLSVDENASEGYFLRGIAKFNLEDLIGADADLTLALEKNPLFTNAYVNRAIIRSRLGNYNDALKDFEEAIELRPDLPNPYYSRGVTRLLNGEFQAAIDDFDSFIRYENKVADAYINRGVSYLQLQDTTAAVANYEQAIRTNRLNPDPYNRRGAIYMQQGRMGDAEADFDMAIKSDSTYMLAFFNRALLYNQSRRPMEALGDMNRVIQLDSTSAVSYFNRAIIRSQIGDYNKALEDYDQVAKYAPHNVLVYFYRANLKRELGDLSGAEEDYTKAIALYPDFANAYLYRSDVRMTMGNSRAAMLDRRTAESKLDEHKSKLSRESYSIYTDSDYDFDRLLSFDNSLVNKGLELGVANIDDGTTTQLRPLFRFTLEQGGNNLPTTTRYYSDKVDAFSQSLDNKLVVLTNRRSNIPADDIIKMDSINRETVVRGGEQSWVSQLELSITQSIIRQYTNSVNSLTEAIKLNARNPFLYLNRSAVRAEMIEFISSIENSYQRISIESDPASRLRSRSERVYSYEESLEDINRAIALYPQFAHLYYNRANLLALSGELPAAYEDYTKAIELYPSFSDAYYNRGIIQIMMHDTSKGLIDISKSGELGIADAYKFLEKYR